MHDAELQDALRAAEAHLVDCRYDLDQAILKLGRLTVRRANANDEYKRSCGYFAQAWGECDALARRVEAADPLSCALTPSDGGNPPREPSEPTEGREPHVNEKEGADEQLP